MLIYRCGEDPAWAAFQDSVAPDPKKESVVAESLATGVISHGLAGCTLSI